ncbi:MAG: hypothetical protein GY711_28740 [bacterium]|nr:hypothetical protein [bacterium]
MGKSIDDYKKKRDFTKTPEPPPEAPAERATDAPPRFVVHRHEARALHYDLRLEMDGVLRSWAVPRGFSYDPAEKRLAVRTEDHPIRYLVFDGVIPKGQYGAGSMTIWDSGHYEVLPGPKNAKHDGLGAVAGGELKVILRGRRLRGEWHVVRTKQSDDSWLLFKSEDRYAGFDRDSALGIDLAAAPEVDFPSSPEPMRPRAAAPPFSDPAWLFEMRFDGRRALLAKRGSTVTLTGEAPQDEVGADALRLRADDALIDGVLVALDAGGRPSRAALDAGGGPLAFYAFDLLVYEEYDLRALPLADRKTALRAIVPEDTAGVLYADHVAGDGESLADIVRQSGLPGVIAKRADSAYASGPSEDWRRIEVDAQATELAFGDALAGAEGKPRASRVKFTNLDKVFFPEAGYTKGDVIDYYDAVAEYLLPYLQDRPVHMNRFPDGIDGKSFYQRHAKEDTPAWVRTVSIDSDSKGEALVYPVCDDRDTLLWHANQGSIDLHPWLSRAANHESPDWCVLDLDAKESPFKDVVKIARLAGKILRGIGLRPLLKTSGATGMHVYIPLLEGYTYDASRIFCEAVARLIARELPDISTIERTPTKRGGKVYLDYGQNRRTQTVVPPYVVRPRPAASVSTPLAWDELETGITPEDFTIANVPERLARIGDLFRPALTDRQDILAAAEALQENLLS